MKNTIMIFSFVILSCLEMDGITFAKWVLEEHSDVKLFSLTAYADVKYMKEAISMQSFDYVLQPVSTEELKVLWSGRYPRLKLREKSGADE